MVANWFFADWRGILFVVRGETDKHKLLEFMARLGTIPKATGSIYLTGGATALLLGWREMTIDVDLKLEPEPAGVFERIATLKNELDINVELAAPDQFIPTLPGWQERSQFIAQHGGIRFYHYDFYSQALAKIERWHDRDRLDVQAMLRDGLVERKRLRELFDQIAPALVRFPAIDERAFRARVLSLTEA